MNLARVLLALLTLGLVACGPSPDPTYLVTKSRILGVRYTAAGDPMRTNARPGETIAGEFILTSPVVAEQNGWVFLFCTPAPTAFGFDFCEDEPFAFVGEATAVDGPPRFEIEIPEDIPGDVLILGGVCMGGDAQIDIDPEGADEGDLNPCVDQGVGQLISGVLTVVREDNDENRPPAISAIRFDGADWTAEPPVERTGCAGGDLPTFRASDSTNYVIEVEAAEGSREDFIDMRADQTEAAVEDLPVAFYSTEMGLDGLFSVIDGDPGDEAFEATVIANREFTPSEIESSVDATGLVVSFDIVMRDDRGGVDRARRAICIIP
ncbi:MAG: hypothetical protein AAF411_05635 [Myxococcota bacterium]